MKFFRIFSGIFWLSVMATAVLIEVRDLVFSLIDSFVASSGWSVSCPVGMVYCRI